MFNYSRYEYLKSLHDQDKLSDILRKEYAALLRQLKEQNPNKMLDENQEE